MIIKYTTEYFKKENERLRNENANLKRDRDTLAEVLLKMIGDKFMSGECIEVEVEVEDEDETE